MFISHYQSQARLQQKSYTRVEAKDESIAVMVYCVCQLHTEGVQKDVNQVSICI